MKKLKINTTQYKNIWFTSDWHLGHNKDFLYRPRFCASRDEHVEWLISRINEIAKPDDLIIHLGDMCLTSTMNEYISWINRIHCRNIWSLTGNHDNRFEEISEKCLTVYPIVNLGPYQELTIIEPSEIVGRKAMKKPVTLCHFPMLIWNKSQHGTFNLCGHSHGSLKESSPFTKTAKRLDCGIENALSWSKLERVMFSWEDIKSVMDKKTIEVLDHHDRSTT